MPLKVLVVSHNYPRKSATGSGLFIHRLNLGLAKLGYQVHVIQIADWAPPWPFALALKEWRGYRRDREDMHDELDGITIHHPAVMHPRPSRFFDPDSWARRSRTINAYVRRRPELAGADVVIGHFLVPDGYNAVMLARTLGIPSCAMAWGDDVHAWPEGNTGWRSKLLDVLRDCDQLVACSRRLAADGAAWSSSPTSWEVVYAGTDLVRFRPPVGAERERARSSTALRGLPHDARVLLMIGQPVVAKGYFELLQAWESLRGVADEWCLVMVGANWGNIDIEAEIERRGLSSRAQWLGQQAASDIPALLQASHGFVLPSHNEGLSLSVMEAMATGVPVVTTDVGGHSEIIRDGENGWLIPPRDVSSLSRALQELITDKGERQRRAANALTTIRAIGTPDDAAKRLAVILERLVERGSRSSAALSPSAAD